MEAKQPEIGRAFGNAEVVEMLERWVEAAKKGNMCYAGVAGILTDGTVVIDHVGPIEVEERFPVVLDSFKAVIEQRKLDRLPTFDPTLDASYACFNCCRQPISFDSIVWLVAAEMRRLRAGAPAPLKVGIWAGAGGKEGLEAAARLTVLEKVFRPALTLIGAVEDYAAVHGGSPEMYPLRGIVEASLRGEPVPKLTPPDYARKIVNSWLVHDEKPITITLRETKAWPHRNSNILAWCKFADWLTARGEMVIFLRDTDKATQPLPGYHTCPLASINIHVRCALYERAKCNIFVSNGPCELARFMSQPWFQLTQLFEESEYLPETRAWRELQGIANGLPWGNTRQQEYFGEQNFETIMETWNAFSKEL